jgi:hypothetical protein
MLHLSYGGPWMTKHGSSDILNTKVDELIHKHPHACD